MVAKIYYFSQFDVLRPTTNRVSDMRLCEGFVENGCDIELIVPYVYRHYNIARSGIFASYGIENAFEINTMPTPFWEGMAKWLNVPIWAIVVALVYLKILLHERERWEDICVVSRDVNSLLPVLWINKALLQKRRTRVVFWAHEVKTGNKRYAYTYRNVDAIMGTNSAIIEDIQKSVGISRDRMVVTLNPVSTRQTKLKLDKQEVRKKLQLEEGRPVVVYTGKLGPGVKEIGYILEAATRLPEYTFLFTGGKPSAVQYYKRYCRGRGIENAMFTGFLDNYPDVFQYQVAADVLVSYYTHQDHLIDYNYPQKITEYMLSGNPLVTPDYRATRDILGADTAIFVEPENVSSLTAGIRRAIEDRLTGERMGSKARAVAQAITFKNRTAILLDFFRSL
jgi:glycosyltransferase involved in cell wall biosynthesis